MLADNKHYCIDLVQRTIAADNKRVARLADCIRLNVVLWKKCFSNFFGVKSQQEFTCSHKVIEINKKVHHTLFSERCQSSGSGLRVILAVLMKLVEH